ncbi:MAG: hypothetical protein H0W88_05420 [Parachlamydiaceae bacterium]|nr:hypothetical protein [Parachlamydiaceae bacterium]
MLKKNHSFLLFIFLSTLSICFAATPEPSENKLKVLYNSLDPKSISQHLAFYDLYGNRAIGKQALQDAWNLMSTVNTAPMTHLTSSALTPDTLTALVSLVNKPVDQPLPTLNEADLSIIESISASLAHNKLKGHKATSEAEVLQLPPSEIDLARGLFLSQYDSDLSKIRSYEAMIDLMALQILVRLPPNASDENKIETINKFIFDEMGFRFPPHSIYSKDIDLYTFLPSVLDSHRGVCLGVSILYLCIAQRLSLPLEMITPPGHIYVRYRTPEKTINIETTARGINMDSDDYLSISTRSLQQRNIKEVLGLAHVNQAAVWWQKEDYQKALEAYLKAEPYMKGDFLLKGLMGYAYIFTGQKDKGEPLLLEIKDHIPDFAVDKDTIPEDYLNGKVDAEGIKAIFKHTEEDRQSILAKKNLIEETVRKNPEFRAGIFHLGIAWIQLHRLGEALDALKKYHSLYQDDPDANFYLAALYEHRMDYNNAWKHLRLAEAILRSRQYDSKMLKEFRKNLTSTCPE